MKKKVESQKSAEKTEEKKIHDVKKEDNDDDDDDNDDNDDNDNDDNEQDNEQDDEQDGEQEEKKADKDNNDSKTNSAKKSAKKKISKTEKVSENIASHPNLPKKEPVYNHVMMVHRILEPQDIYFLASHKPRTIGRPFILSYIPQQTKSNDFHKQVWNSLKKFVNFPDLPPNVEGYPWEKVKDKLPYTLHKVTRNGSACSVCSWNKNCEGCLLKNNDKFVSLKDRETIGITWSDPTKLDEYFSENKTREVIRDKTWSEARAKDREQISLAYCLREFLSEEKLEGDNLYFCSTCKDHFPSFKKIDFWKFPPILIIHLKRFEQLGRQQGVVKIDRMVEFPRTKLKFTQLLGKKVIKNDDDPEYNLYACLNHYGSLGRGHYTAYCNNPQDSKWYCFDDSRCALLDDEKSIESSAAYLLFYVQENFTGIDLNNFPAVKEEDNKCTIM